MRDPDHSFDETRFLVVGTSNRQRLLIVSYAERGVRFRVISARELTASEKRAYETAREDLG